jgi:site-specific recombinase XerD
MIQEYINYLLNIRGYSSHTANSYRKDLEHFTHWMQKNIEGARWSTITRDIIDQYVTAQAQDGLSPATTNRRLSAISGLYNYMKRQGYDVHNPCRFESRRKQAQTVPNTIPVADLKRAYEQAGGVTKVMIGLLSTTGMRIQELLDLNYEDIDFEDNSIRVSGKGKKERIVYTTESILDTLRAVRTYYNASGKIFTFDQRQARYMIWQALKEVSNARQLSPHAIRHTVATNMATHGANVTTIAQILGHKHIETTQRYIDMTQANVRQACQQYSLFN